MQTVTLTTPVRSQTYPIIVGSSLINKISTIFDFQPFSSMFIITDQNVAKLWLEKLQASISVKTAHVVLEAGEPSKQAQTLEQIWTAMHQAGCDRKSLVITLGGGVIGDMGGFAAATYMRGVSCLNIPTTLLSQIDSSIGGKTAIDFAGVKNLVGTFTQPRAVIIDTDILTTLPDREFLAGFAEIIKHGLIRDAAYVEQTTKKRPREFTSEELAAIIARSCEIKANVVQNDETEGGLRKVLNFGHTIGHAIESLSLETAQPLLHGEAVSIGMVVETKLSVDKGILSQAEADAIRQHLIHAGLPVVSPRFALPDIFKKMQSDKKNERGTVLFTLLEGIGNGVWNQEVDSTAVAAALEATMEKQS